MIVTGDQFVRQTVRKSEDEDQDQGQAAVRARLGPRVLADRLSPGPRQSRGWSPR